ncbi:MAG: carbohydrate porin [Nitrosomonadales bacterium]|nr:carbohydrate porin [Nitrosomonadales bacterium]
MKQPRHLALALAITGILSAPAHAETNTEDRLRALELRLNTLENENRSLKDQVRQTEQKVDATGTQMERIASQGGASSTATKFGGYGELHLNKLKNRKAGGSNKDELDLHRFVIFMGHEFSEQIRFFSELEVEHAMAKDTAAGSSGVVAVEQAYLDFTVSDALSVKAGMMVMPVGIISETHEPPTFYGVERNPVETSIIPTTWREGGVAVTARMANNISIDGMISSGLATTAAKNYAVRDGRLSVASAKAKDPAYTARLKWTGIPGIELATTVQHQADITQSADATAGAATLYEAHAVVNHGRFGLRTLYAGWNLDGSGPKAVGADKQNGWYVEPSWKFTEQWGVFVRRSTWDNRAGDVADSRYKQTDFGVNYWPHADVVVKLDYQNQQVPGGQDEFDGFNLGLGYQF